LLLDSYKKLELLQPLADFCVSSFCRHGLNDLLLFI